MAGPHHDDSLDRLRDALLAVAVDDIAAQHELGRALATTMLDSAARTDDIDMRLHYELLSVGGVLLMRISEACARIREMHERLDVGEHFSEALRVLHDNGHHDDAERLHASAMRGRVDGP